MKWWYNSLFSAVNQRWRQEQNRTEQKPVLKETYVIQNPCFCVPHSSIHSFWFGKWPWGGHVCVLFTILNIFVFISNPLWLSQLVKKTLSSLRQQTIFKNLKCYLVTATNKNVWGTRLHKCSVRKKVIKSNNLIRWKSSAADIYRE